ncbi:GntR family transcriptional regulator [Actinopolymorpha alba]|uniref:GntR family transcriptional regulator n=1 Tax=Actinopolymorpha alba TaxID=533267 RepID=UPI000362D33E|nr:GntR family transcriptional regulator [Actinopolymorpha alba]
MANRSEPFDPTAYGLPAQLDEDQPKGDQLREALESLAAHLGPGAPLPSERQLADAFGVARMTVRGEVRRLAADGVIRLRARAAAIVADPAAPRYTVGYSFAHELARRGKQAGSIVQEHNILRVTPRLAELLEVPAGTRALRLVRVRTADGQPTGVERPTLSLERFPGLEDVDFEHASLYETIRDRWGAEPSSVQAHVTAVHPSADDAELLGIDDAVPCLLVTLVQRDTSGQVIEAGRSIYRGDRYDLDISRRATTLPMPAAKTDLA